MLTKEILESHPVSVLKKEISKTNIKGYSKMKKPEVVELMMKHKERFDHIKKREPTKKEPKKPKKEEPKKAEPKKAEPKKAEPKKRKVVKKAEPKFDIEKYRLSKEQKRKEKRDKDFKSPKGDFYNDTKQGREHLKMDVLGEKYIKEKVDKAKTRNELNDIYNNYIYAVGIPDTAKGFGSAVERKVNNHKKAFEYLIKVRDEKFPFEEKKTQKKEPQKEKPKKGPVMRKKQSKNKMSKNDEKILKNRTEEQDKRVFIKTKTAEIKINKAKSVDEINDIFSDLIFDTSILLTSQEENDLRDVAKAREKELKKGEQNIASNFIKKSVDKLKKIKKGEYKKLRDAELEIRNERYKFNQIQFGLKEREKLEEAIKKERDRIIPPATKEELEKVAQGRRELQKRIRSRRKDGKFIFNPN